jgi:hypothetical protein
MVSSSCHLKSIRKEDLTIFLSLKPAPSPHASPLRYNLGKASLSLFSLREKEDGFVNLDGAREPIQRQKNGMTFFTYSFFMVSANSRFRYLQFHIFSQKK